MLTFLSSCSTNILEIIAALNAVCKIVTEDMIPAVITDVTNLLKYDSEFVRRRAVSALHRFYQMDKHVLADHIEKIRRSLCDPNPSVMGATLPLFHAMIQDDVMQFKDLVPSFVSILKQITEHRLPRDFDYHRIPSPWIQMNILRILALLGRGDQQASEGMYEVLVDAMKRSDTGINVGYAIVYECVKTITTIYPNTMLMDAAATSISRFIRSDSHNLKYVGIRGLAAIVKDHPRYAADHQMAVIDCLEDPDETLKRKTLDLLFRMTNAVNVEFIVDKLLSFLKTSGDDHFRADLVNQITQCAERFAPSNTWYVQTIIQVFELAGDKVKASVAQTLTQLIAEGAAFEDDDENVSDAKDNELRTEAVEHFLILISKLKLPAILAQTMAWVLGEYGYLSTSSSKEVIMNKLCDLLQHSRDCETKASIITALSKLIAQAGTCPSRVLSTITFYSQSKSLDLQQRCLEVLALLKISDIMADVLPVDASCEDIDIDERLSFLNGFVQVALDLGARPYNPPAEFLKMLEDDGSDRKTSLKITPYEMPKIPAPTQVGSIATNAAVGMPGGSTSLAVGVGALPNQPIQPLSNAPTQGNQLLNSRGVNQVWGKKPEPPPPAPAPAPAPPSPVPGVPAAASHDGQSSVNGSPVPGIANVPGMWGQHTQQAATQPAAAPAPEVPKVLTEKEKMAAALFGGVGGKGAAASSAKRRVSSTTSAPAAYSPPGANSAAPSSSQPVAAPAVDIFHEMNAVAPAHPVAPVKSSSSQSNELLDLLSDGPAHPAPVAAPPVQPAAVNVFDNMNFHAPPAPTPAPAPAHNAFGNGNLLAPQPPHAHPPAAPAHAPSAAVNLISDVFGSIDLNNSATSTLAVANDLVKPLPINTAEFGRRWGSSPIDAKQSVNVMHFSRVDLDTLRRSMPTNYHHVESIPSTLESIFAATVTNIGAVVLVHAKLNVPRKTIDVLVKSSSADICQREASFIANHISSFRG